ncbi:16091_t:CDS:1 [Dentiscutata heterogama]|uniref:16091_t:CDS:1 n=1 Tax=Dentiscutata heterogama TaxID=1316150 RepID=A0ACA9K0P9_9GLOM|nr:16091_t:CDS:1 [Dentiscutata heterogama]
MPQQKTRINSTLACVNCQWRHVKCVKLLGEDSCTNCRKYSRPCIYIPGNKRGPKRHRLNTRIANLRLFSNIDPYRYEAAHIQYQKQLTGDSLYPELGIDYTQHQPMPNIDSISYPTPGIHVAYSQYQGQLTPNIGNSSHPISETNDIQNKLVNQSNLSSSFFVHNELMPNNKQKNIMSSSNSSTNDPNDLFSFRTQHSYNNNIDSYDTTKSFHNTFIDQFSLIPSSFVHDEMLYDEQILYDEQNINPFFNSFST